MNLKKPLGIAARLTVTFGAMYLAFSHVSLGNVLPLIKQLPVKTVVMSLIFIHIGQCISAMRTRYYLHAQDVDFPTVPALQLHYIGGLFNAFLPGGAGGDAYKAWWLKHHKKGKLLDMVKLMIAGRLNGLWALGIILCGMAYSNEALRSLVPMPRLTIPAVLFAGTTGYMLLARTLLKEPYAQQRQALLYSLGLQLMLVATAFTISSGLGLGALAPHYVFLFMLSCMLAMLPISIGGIGVRELAVLKGTQLMQLSGESGVALAFAFTVLNLSIPLIGAVLHSFFAPEKGLTHA